MLNNIKTIGEVISSEPGLEKVKKLIKQSEVLEKFFDIFPELNKVAEPQKIEKKILYIKVENAAWRSELKFQSEKVVEKINKYFGEQRVNYIRLNG
jgi:hypothetical protein